MVQNPSWPMMSWQVSLAETPQTSILHPYRRWQEITDRVTAFECTAGRQYELAQMQAGVGSLKVLNQDEALSPSNVASPYYPATPTYVRSGTVASGATQVNSLSAPITSPAIGNIFVVVANTNYFSVTPQGTGWQPIYPGGVGNGFQAVLAWWKLVDGTESNITVKADGAGLGTFLFSWAEYSGVEMVVPLDASGYATTATPGTTLGATTTATTQPVDLAVFAAATHSFLLPPSGFTFTHANVRTWGSTTFGTSSANCSLVLADFNTAVTGTVTDTATWTNSSDHSTVIGFALKARSQLQPWKAIRGWGMWPSTASGNLLNSANDGWAARRYASNATTTTTTQWLSNPEFNVDTAGWWASAGTLSWDNVIRHSGAGSAKRVATGPGSVESTPVVGATPGQVVTFQAWLRADTARQLRLQVNWFDSGIAYISSSATTTVTVPANAWTFFHGTATVPAGIAYMDLGGVDITSTAGQIMWLDDAWLSTDSTASFTPSFADTATPAGGTVGTWENVFATVANSNYRSYAGSRSTLITWPTTGTPRNLMVATDLPPLKTGVTYTLSAWVYVPTDSAPVALIWHDQVGAPSAVFDAWTRISITSTRPDGGGTYGDRAFLVTDGVSVLGQQVWVDAVQLEMNGAPTAFSTTGSGVYPIHGAYIERYPESWTNNGFLGWMDLTTVDALGALPKPQLQDCMTNDIMQDSPLVAYPLTDSTGLIGGGAYDGDVKGGMNILTQGVGGPGPTFGAAGGPGPDGLTCVSFAPSATGPTAYDFNTVSISQKGTLWTGDVGSGISFELWIKTTFAGTQVVMCCVGYGSSGLDVFTSGGNVGIRETNDGGATWGYDTGQAAYIGDGSWHHVVVTETASGGTVTARLYVDGALIVSPTRTASSAFGTYAWVIGGQWWPNIGYPFTGQVARFGWYRYTLSADRIKSHYQSGHGFPYDTTGDRMRRVLAWMPWGGATNIPSTGTAVAPAAGYGGKTVTDVLKALQETENGPLYADPTGVLTLLPRQHYYAQAAPRWTLGESALTGEAQYGADFSTDQDPTFLVNRVTITAAGVSQVMTNKQSQSLYFAVGKTLDTVHQRAEDATALGAYILWRYGKPRVRTANLVIRPGCDPTLWPVALGVRIGDRVDVMRRTSAGTYSYPCFVENIRHAVTGVEGPDAWVVSLQLSPVDHQQAGRIGDATYGRVGYAVIVY